MNNIRQAVREWLGMEDLTIRMANLQMTLEAIARNQGHDVRVHNQALARLIAKLDPIYLKDELAPMRRADSDRIAAEVLAKLSAELMAARQTGGQDL